MQGVLYVVATPIGNLEDITLRAIKVLKEVDLILAEDTRKTGILLKHFDIKTPLDNYHQHTPHIKYVTIINKLLEGKNIALVTDAGTPGVSDPGNELIDFIYEYSTSDLGFACSNFLEGSRSAGSVRNSALAKPELGIKIVPIPGASAITTALSICGFDVNKFVFLGFLPKKGKKKIFGWLQSQEAAFAFYESPYRIKKTLEVLIEYFGEKRRVCVCRELTKMFESVYRGNLKTVWQKISDEKIKGEIIVIVDKN
jgi:16S rRNA (cytidine1402-2'-O)-methyltransferase